MAPARDRRPARQRQLEKLPPKAAICDAFDSYCDEAVQVASCESRLNPSAQNGQYLGLFQMGSYARQLYGHGPTAHDQAVAAHRYFVSSGRDWSPWSCKPYRAYLTTDVFCANCEPRTGGRVSLRPPFC